MIGRCRVATSVINEIYAELNQAYFEQAKGEFSPAAREKLSFQQMLNYLNGQPVRVDGSTVKRSGKLISDQLWSALVDLFEGREHI